MNPYDCTDIDLRMHDAIHGGLDEDERQAFFAHVAECADCRRVYMSMSLTERPGAPEAVDLHAAILADSDADADAGADADADADADDADADAENRPGIRAPFAHSVDPGSSGHIPVPPPPTATWSLRQSWIALVSMAALALIVGWIAGSRLADQRAAELEDVRVRLAKSEALVTSKEATIAKRDAHIATLSSDVAAMATRINTHNQQLEKLQLENSELLIKVARLEEQLARKRAGTSAQPAPGAVCRPDTTRMEFRPEPEWSQCGQPTEAAYKDPNESRIYWSVHADGQPRSCFCTAL